MKLVDIKECLRELVPGATIIKSEVSGAGSKDKSAWIIEANSMQKVTNKSSIASIWSLKRWLVGRVVGAETSTTTQQPGQGKVYQSSPAPNRFCTLSVYQWIMLLFALQLTYLPRLTLSCYVYPPDVKDPCKGKECSFGAQCVPSLDGLTARCQCPERCNRYGDSVGSTPVCGSDGQDYNNQCEMRRTACREMKDIRVKYFGKCGEYSL